MTEQAEMKVTHFTEYQIGEVESCPICGQGLRLFCKKTEAKGKISHRVEPEKCNNELKHFFQTMLEMKPST